MLGDGLRHIYAFWVLSHIGVPLRRRESNTLSDQTVAHYILSAVQVTGDYGLAAL